MREFTTSVEQATDSQKAGEPETVKIDGYEVTFQPPDTNHIVLLTAALESSAGQHNLAATLINAFFALIENPADSAHFRARLFDPKDTFGLDTISEVMMGLLEEWSARPTQSSPTSSSQRQSTGRTSRATHSGQGSHRGTTLSPVGAPSPTDGSGDE